MKNLIPIALLILVLVVAALLPKPRDRSCELLKSFQTPRLFVQCLFGAR